MAADAPAGNTRYKILYTDDDDLLLEIGKLFLERIKEFSVETTDSPTDALKMIISGSYDAVVSDYEMPEMNGIELLRMVRSNGLLIPFIIFTGRGREEVVIEALNSGADFYLQKGGEPKSQFAELEHKIKSAIERREAIDALRISREQLSEMISALPDPTFAIDTSHRVIAWNRAIEEISGVSWTEMIGKGEYAYTVPFTGAFEPFIIDLVLDPAIQLSTRYPEFRREGEKIIAENHFHLQAGERYLRIHAGPLYAEDHQIAGAIATIRDITDQFLSELELKNAVSVYQNVANFAADWEYWENPEGQIIYCSPSARIITGYSSDEFKRDPMLLSRIVYPGDVKIWEEHAHTNTRSDQQGRIEFRIITRGGEIRWIEHVCTPVFGTHEIYIGHRVSNRDITERTRISGELYRKNEDLCAANEEITSIEEELREQYTELAVQSDLLRESEERLKGIITEAPIGIHLFELRGDQVFLIGANPAADLILGRDHWALLGKKIDDAFPNFRGSPIPGLYRDIIRNKRSLDTEWISRDGDTIRGVYEIHAFQSGENRMAEFFVDITERKRAEEVLKASENRVRNTLNAILMTGEPMQDLSLIDLLDIEEIQSLMHDFSEFVKIPIAVLDLDGNILIASGWQDICTKFHRVHPESCKHCHESDLLLTSGIKYGAFKLYRCRNNLWDIATPLVIGGEHVGNIFAGQILLSSEPVDESVWREQAARYGFDEEAYLDALKKVQVWDLKDLNLLMAFFTKLTHLICQFSYSRIKLARSLTEQKNLTEQIRESELKFRRMFANSPIGYELYDPNGVLIDVNAAFLRTFGILDRDKILGSSLWEKSWLPPEHKEHLLAGEEIHFEILYDFGAIHEHAFQTRRSDEACLEVDITPLSGDGGIIAYLTHIQDISRRKEMEQALRERIVTLTLPRDSKGLKFLDLFNLADIQRIQDLFSEATGVASIITTPDGTPITEPSNFSRFCQLIRGTERGSRNCRHSDAALGCLHSDGPIIQTCFSGGLWDAGASITVGGEHIANWLIGQVQNEEINIADLLSYADDIGVDREVFEEALREVPVMSREQFTRIAKTLSSFAEALSLKAYQNIQQARFICEQEQVENALLQANKQLHLLSSVTRHDIQNKISGMVGYFELLKELPKSDEVNLLLTKIEELTLNIHDQIEFTRVYQDLGVSDPIWHDLSGVLPRTHLPPSVSMEVSLPMIEIYADPILEKVFYLLLDNTIRHGERVTRISVSAEQKEDLIIIWEDDGVGISDTEKELIFSRGYGKNTGLGLFLIREILDITGISIKEIGRFGTGARFELTVPPGKFRYRES